MKGGEMKKKKKRNEQESDAVMNKNLEFFYLIKNKETNSIAIFLHSVRGQQTIRNESQCNSIIKFKKL